MLLSGVAVKEDPANIDDAKKKVRLATGQRTGLNRSLSRQPVSGKAAGTSSFYRLDEKRAARVEKKK